MALSEKAARIIDEAAELVAEIRRLTRRNAWRFDESLDEDVEVFEAPLEVEILASNVGLFELYCREAHWSRRPKFLTADDIRRERRRTLRRMQWLCIILARILSQVRASGGMIDDFRWFNTVEQGYRKWYKYHW